MFSAIGEFLGSICFDWVIGLIGEHVNPPCWLRRVLIVLFWGGLAALVGWLYWLKQQ